MGSMPPLLDGQNHATAAAGSAVALYPPESIMTIDSGVASNNEGPQDAVSFDLGIEGSINDSGFANQNDLGLLTLVATACQMKAKMKTPSLDELKITGKEKATVKTSIQKHSVRHFDSMVVARQTDHMISSVGC